MATCTSTPSSLMLTYASSSVCPSDLTPSFLSFKPKPILRAFALYPLGLRPRERKASNWVVDGNLQREAKPAKDLVVVAAVAAEAEVVEAVEEQEGEEGATGSVAVTTPKPKKGKAALLLKRDRVCEKLCLFVVDCCDLMVGFAWI